MNKPSPRVLIVEDESAIADVVIYTLDSEGIANDWVATGQQAIADVKAHTPDIVLLDIGLPDMSGFDVCRAIRAFSNVPIIFLTSRSSDIDQVVGLELGADDYITKPFEPRVLSARIGARLRRHQEPPSTPVGEAESDFVDAEQQQAIYLDQVKIELSRYEYRILSHMLKQPKRIFSRDVLMSAAWENPDSSFDRTVDTHIKTIRKKIKAIRADFDPIKTHRNQGYSFEAD
ncbi:UNVERIFIED_CONTAM: hypothetical protein GTU68_051681 [Idotea baltica]|nr:hypothetical protein [Idotea baltica]